jgi:hypothetical protein
LASPLARQFIGDAGAIWACNFLSFFVTRTSPVQRRWNGGANNMTKPLAPSF